MANERSADLSDVQDDEWAFCVAYLRFMKDDALAREYSSRELFIGLCQLARPGIAWRLIPNDLSPWSAVSQRAQR